MLKVILGTLKRSAQRYIAPALAVAVGTLLLSVILFAQESLLKASVDEFSGGVNNYDLVVENPSGELTAESINKVRDIDGVKESFVVGFGYSEAGPNNRGTLFTLRHPDATLAEGEWPTGAEELAISSGMAEAQGLSVGDSLQVYPHRRQGQGRDQVDATVVGIIDLLGPGSFSGQDQAVTSVEGLEQYNGGFAYVGLLVADGRIDAVRAAVDDSLDVKTGDEAAKEALDEARTAMGAIAAALSGFAFAALLAAGLVVNNTFAVLLAQRQRTTALLRLLGATRRQTYLGVLAEAAVIGFAAGILGLFFGYLICLALAAALGPMLGVSSLTVAFTPLAVAGPILAGLLTTILAALRSASSAAKTSPIEAGGGVAARSSVGRVRIALGALLGVPGLFGLVAVASFAKDLGPELGIALGAAASVMVIAGALVCLPLLVKGAATLIHRALPRTWVSGKVTAQMIVRDPKRASATAAALLIAVGLVVTLDTGAANAREGAVNALGSTFLTDAEVTFGSETGLDRDRFDTTEKDKLLAIDGVQAVAAVATLPGYPPATGPEDAQFGLTITVIDDDVAATLRGDSPLTSLPAGKVLVSENSMKMMGLEPLDSLVLGDPAANSPIPVVKTSELPDSVAGAVRAEDVKDLVVTSPDGYRTILVRYADDADLSAVRPAVEKWASDASDAAMYASAATERADIEEFINGLAVFALIMTAAAMIVALIGVGNTVALSTIENTQRIGLTRAIGLTSNQARMGVLWEAILLSAMGASIGLVLGVLCGWAGSRAVLADIAADVGLVVNAWHIVGVLAIVAVAAVLASALPAYRAGRMSAVSAMRKST